MELISWSLNGINKIISTRRAGSGEPSFPDVTFAAGHMMDLWKNWRVLCLDVLSVEDIEDVYLFGFMIAGHLLLGLGVGLVYRKIGKTAAIQEGQRQAVMINEFARTVITPTLAISEANRKMDSILERITVLVGEVARLCALRETDQREG